MIEFENAASGRRCDNSNAYVGIGCFSECDSLLAGKIDGQPYSGNDFVATVNKLRYLPEVITGFKATRNIAADGIYGQIEFAGRLYGADLIQSATEVLSTGRTKPHQDFSLISQFGDVRNWFADRASALAGQYSRVMTEFCQNLFYGLEPVPDSWQPRQGFPDPIESGTSSGSLYANVSSPFPSFDLRGDSRYPFDAGCGRVYQTLAAGLTEQDVFACMQYGSTAGVFAEFESYDEHRSLRIRLLQILRELKQDIARASTVLQIFADAVGVLVVLCSRVIPHTIATSQRSFYTHHGAHPPDRQFSDLAAVSGGGTTASH